MKKLLLFLLFSVTVFTVHAYPVRLTATYFGGSGNEILHDVAFADDGTLIVIGTTDNTSALTVPGNIPTYLFGNDNPSSLESAYILRLSNNGQQILSFSRFATGSIKIKDLRLAVTENGIYIVAVGYSAFAQLPGFDGKIDSAPGSKPAIVRVSLDGSQILNATYLGGGDSDRDVNDIDVFPNGDLCVNHDKNGDWADYLSRIKPDLSGFVWTRTFDVWCGSARTNAITVSPQGDLVYVGGYGMGNTGLEPYKDPYLFSFNGSDGSQNWKRGSNSKDYGVFNFPQAAIGANRLISDSQVNALGTDSLGNILMIGYSDGGATVFQYDPWYGGYYNTTGAPVPAGISDGDSFAGFSGATSASTIGLMNKNGEWIRMHAIKPYNTWNRWYGVTRGYNGAIFYTGRTSGIPDVEPWESGGSNGVLMKVVYDPILGTQRKFVTHPAGVDAMNKVARDRNTYRYAAVGTATTASVFCVDPFQNTFGGGNDGYIVVFDDNDKEIDAEEIITTEDTNIRMGDAAKTFGTAATLLVKRQDDRPANTSKAYFKFNLQDIQKPIKDARLLLYKSGKYDNGKAIVYALKKGFDNWSETTLTWNNSSAFGNDITSAWSMDKTKTDSLGIFQINKTNTSEKVVYQGTDFTNYIETRRLAGDASITFVLTTQWVNSNGDPVIQPASKESTGVLKPTLQLIYDRNASIPESMRLWPENITLLPNVSRKFYANLFDQYGSIMNKPVTFSVNNGGTISNDGVFQASAPGIYTITAQSEGITATTTVIIGTPTQINGIQSAGFKVFADKNIIRIFASDNQQFSVNVYALNGHLIQKSAKTCNYYQFKLNCVAGVYIVQIVTTQDVVTQKVVIK